MRSLLLVPCGQTASFDAAFAAAPDALVLDLASACHDLVNREAARQCAHDVLCATRSDPSRPHLYVRLQLLDDGEFDRDLRAVMAGEPDGILLAASRSGADVQHLAAKLAVHEAEYDLADGETSIIAEAASRALSLFDLGSYRTASKRLLGLSWDAVGLIADVGGSHEPYGATSFPPAETARHLMLFAARAAGVAAIDTASLSDDPDAIRIECRTARRYGFNAKLATTAAEVAIINEEFGSEAERH